MQNINDLVEALKEGKYIRPIKYPLRISPTIPIIKIEYRDGTVNYKEDDLELYFYEGININYRENIRSIKIVGSRSSKIQEVEYIYFNSQCNRCFAKLKNGDSTDYSPALTSFIYNEFEIIDDKALEKENIKKVTMEEVYAKFGCKVEII